jgi:protein-S-isoprenylcysteine O-methyltransferase Ste14
MTTILRHLLAILILPFTVVALVPRWLLLSFASVDSRWPTHTPAAWIPRLLGGGVFLCGFALFCWCVALFARVGRGTLAPWDPTRKLVAVGPYRFVRNPMISSVATMLIGEALFWGSWRLALWTTVFILINHSYFVVSEEPGLEARFGESYRTYTANVPRWVPRGRPWEGGSDG